MKTFKAQLVESYRSDNMLTFLCSQKPRINRDEYGNILADLHNEKRISLTSETFIRQINNLEKDIFWQIVHAFNKAIPKIECEWVDIIKLVNALTENAKGDLFANQPRRSFIQWCKNNQIQAESIIESTKKTDETAMDWCRLALLGLNNIQQIFDLYDNPKRQIQKIAISAIGDIDIKTIAGINNSINICASQIKDNLDSDQTEISIESLFKLWKKGRTIHKQDEIIDFITENINNKISVLLSAMLFYHCEGITQRNINKILTHLVAESDIEVANQLHWIGMTLYNRDAKWSFKLVADAIRKLLAQTTEETDNEGLHAFVEWSQESTENISYVTSSWLLNGNMISRTLLSNSILYNIDKDIQAWIHKKDLPPDTQTQIFLARKCIGFLMFQPITAGTILFSIVKNGTSEARIYAEDLLWNPLLLSFGGKFKDFSKDLKQDKSKRIAKIATKLTHQYAKYTKDITSTGNLVEFEVSSRKQQAKYIKTQKFKQQVKEQTDKRSTLLDLVQKQVLLYGNKTLYSYKNGNGAPTYEISPLTHFSHSFEIPRLGIIDEANLESRMKICRVESK